MTNVVRISIDDKKGTELALLNKKTDKVIKRNIHIVTKFDSSVAASAD